MAKHTFGEPISDEDVLVIQGVEYPMMPVGMRAMRRLLDLKQRAASLNIENPEEAELTGEELDISIDIVAAAVRPEFRDKLKEHIEESIPPQLLTQIATVVMQGFSDVDPTQPELSSGGSSATGSSSTDGVLPAPSMPTS